ncbi:MAG TPA: Gfo/Idh/MocA family oxidoreductase [Bryobacteraceae bacterium]|jgi:predicted dehydrogenase|nr:Gfo/Idh/MocA family oxidoreductase [Bryobacteraceae bacterium]
MKTNRRAFLMASGLTALAATRAVGANDVVRVGAIGCGGRMQGLIGSADKAGGYQLVAVCDVYEPRREEFLEKSGNEATTHLDYQEVLAKPDVDAVIIAVPNHWHVRIARDALAADKDVYLEKPVTHTLEEAEPLIHAVRSSNRVLQCGMQQRSWVHFQNAVDLIQGGSLGRITQVRTYWYQNYNLWLKKPADPALLDWKRWLGSAPDQPFTQEKFANWRWFWNFGGGAMTDLFAHWIDVVQWAMKTPEPSVAQTMGDRYFFEEWDCPDTIQSAFRYPGFEVGYEGTMVSSIDDGGLEFRGTKATLKINRGGFQVYREGVRDNPVLSERSFEDGTIDHMRNFFDCVRNRKEPNAPVEAGVACARAGHIGNLALRRGEKITWPLNSDQPGSHHRSATPA